MKHSDFGKVTNSLVPLYSKAHILHDDQNLEPCPCSISLLPFLFSEDWRDARVYG
jgi:hypothetical protein